MVWFKDFRFDEKGINYRRLSYLIKFRFMYWIQWFGLEIFGFMRIEEGYKLIMGVAN